MSFCTRRTNFVVAAAQDSGHAKEQTGAQEASLTDLLNKSDDYAELRAARAEEREPRFTGS
jgi:hypothetical protein